MGERLFPMTTKKKRCCWLLFHFQNGQPIFSHLINCNSSRNGEDYWMWCTEFNDVGGSVIIKEEVFVKWMTIFKKKSKRLLLYLLANIRMENSFFKHVFEYKIVIVFSSKLCGKGTSHTWNTFSFICFLVQNCTSLCVENTFNGSHL